VEEKDYWKNLVVGGRLILIQIFKKLSGMAWTGFMWLRTETRGELLCTWSLTFAFCKVWEIAGLAEELCDCRMPPRCK
jgi:hypothetical protein